jgi:hypothetical protein
MLSRCHRMKKSARKRPESLELPRGRRNPCTLRAKKKSARNFLVLILAYAPCRFFETEQMHAGASDAFEFRWSRPRARAGLRERCDDRN